MRTRQSVAVNPPVQSNVKILYIHPNVYAAMLKAGDVRLHREVTSAPNELETFTAIAGMPYAITAYALASHCRQTPKPRSKKRRIQNKWATNPRNWEDVDLAYLVDRSKPWASPVVLSNFSIPHITDAPTLFEGLERAMLDHATPKENDHACNRSCTRASTNP